VQSVLHLDDQGIAAQRLELLQDCVEGAEAKCTVCHECLLRVIEDGMGGPRLHGCTLAHWLPLIRGCFVNDGPTAAAAVVVVDVVDVAVIYG
jgi:hypothetical protein